MLEYRLLVSQFDVENSDDVSSDELLEEDDTFLVLQNEHSILVKDKNKSTGFCTLHILKSVKISRF